MDKLEKGIALYTSGKTLLQAWKESGCGRNKLQKTLKERGLMRSNKENSRKYTLNHDFFDVIDTEEKAYWLGFIYADGYVLTNRTQRCVGISLSRKDRHHLEKFIQAIQATYPIKDYIGESFNKKKIEYSRILLTSDKMYNDLITKGVTEHKTLTLTFPTKEIVPDKYIHHFIRGYFDGDGSFASDGKGRYRIKIEGTPDFLEEMAWKYGIWIDKENLHRRHKDRNTSATLEINRIQEVKDFADYMYRDATVYLDRKYKRYLSI